jgi:hypothetical protein
LNDKNKKNSHYDHFLTPNERVFYARQSIEGTQQIIDEMWKIIKNPKTTEDRKMMALELAFDGTKSKIEMLRIIKQMYQDFYPIADHDHDYGR